MVDSLSVELFCDGRWCPAARVERRAGPSRAALTWLEYDMDHVAEHLHARGHVAVSERFPVDYTLHDLATFPAFCVDLMPQGEARRSLAAELRERGLPASDWAILRHGAGSPVGNLRVAPASEDPPGAGDGVGREDVVSRGDSFREWALAEQIPMTGSSDTQGASPKLLLTEDASGRLHADGALPDARARRHFIVKFARGRTRRDAMVLAHEAPYLELARWLGLRCGAPLEYESGALFVPRFDRERGADAVRRHGLESAYSLLGEVEGGAKLAFESVCAKLAQSVDDVAGDIGELVMRDAVSLALGNPDNHGRNIALLKRDDGEVALSPLYDFAPMFLDPELIKRRTHWRSEPAAGGAPDWRDVLSSVADYAPRELLLPKLRELARRLREAPPQMRALGVDDEVIELTTPWLADVASGLLAEDL